LLFIRSLMTLAFMIFFALPARASTVPLLDLKRYQLAVSTGLFDGSADFALTDRWSVGATTQIVPLFFIAIITTTAVRTTYRLGEGPAGLIYGLSASVMHTDEQLAIDDANTIGEEGELAFAWALPVNQWLTLRGTVGSIYGQQTSTDFLGSTFRRFIMPIWVNLELAIRMYQPASIAGTHDWLTDNGTLEFTLGGNSLLGVRFAI
jgi:hypothetical protein